MVAGMAKTRNGQPEERTRLHAALAGARKAGARLRSLIDEDAVAYDAVVAAFKLPKASDDDKARRKSAVNAAMRKATEVPLETATECQTVIELAQEAAACGNPNAISDARTGAALAWAGLLGAIENVRINAAPDGWGPEARGSAEALLASARERMRALQLF
jgi:formiminotetrahydrofolate cyclodeaminase